VCLLNLINNTIFAYRKKTSLCDGLNTSWGGSGCNFFTSQQPPEGLFPLEDAGGSSPSTGSKSDIVGLMEVLDKGRTG
jgi:hypothetical protein